MSKVSIVSLNKVYKNGVRALENVNLNIEDGEFVSLIGISGAGKTSLMRIINGSVTPTEGRILIDGNSMFESGRKQKRELQKRIGTIYQDFCLVDGLTCYENVLNGCLAERNLLQTIGGIFTKEQRDYADFAISEVGLSDKKHMRAGELSGGQKQRTAIARAIMQKPDILLADEPVASLDPYTSEQILDLIRHLQQEHQLTVIMNSHNVEASLKYSDRLIGIKQGRVVLNQTVLNVTKEEIQRVYEAHNPSEGEEKNDG